MQTSRPLSGAKAINALHDRNLWIGWAIVAKFVTAANKILITTESREFVILHRGRSETRPCEGCGDTMAIFVGIDEAVVMTGMRAMELLGMALRGGVHLAESEEGLLLACRTSLAALEKTEEWSYEEIVRS